MCIIGKINHDTLTRKTCLFGELTGRSAARHWRVGIIVAANYDAMNILPMVIWANRVEEKHGSSRVDTRRVSSLRENMKSFDKRPRVVQRLYWTVGEAPGSLFIPANEAIKGGMFQPGWWDRKGGDE